MNKTTPYPVIVITPGEPAGVGPELTLQLAQRAHPAGLVAVADPDLMAQRAAQIGSDVKIRNVERNNLPRTHQPGELCVLPVSMAAPATAGELNTDNAAYVLDTLTTATQLCLDGLTHALVTGPVQKSVINQAGIAFTGHTEFLRDLCGVDQVVMMLASDEMRVALATTHLPLRNVADAITKDSLARVIRITTGDLQRRYGLHNPRLLVLGLNPHAGESGHMGREEIEVISPLLNELRSEGMILIGPLPADTAFTPRHLSQCDAVLAMYHDQGLPVLKYQSFGNAINITLGLPIIRTSVDHGTALDLAGTGRADSGSFAAALKQAIELATLAGAGAE